MKEIERAIELITAHLKITEQFLENSNPKTTNADVLKNIEDDKKDVVSYNLAIQVLQSELDRQENKALTVEELILLLDENERYPIWYQYANYEPIPEIMTAVTTNRHTGEYKIYFIDENFAIVSEHTKFYKHKPNGGK